jgi:hypothetical protein
MLQGTAICNSIPLRFLHNKLNEVEDRLIKKILLYHHREYHINIYKFMISTLECRIQIVKVPSHNSKKIRAASSDLCGWTLCLMHSMAPPKLSVDTFVFLFSFSYVFHFFVIFYFTLKINM